MLRTAHRRLTSLSWRARSFSTVLHSESESELTEGERERDRETASKASEDGALLRAFHSLHFSVSPSISASASASASASEVSADLCAVRSGAFVSASADLRLLLPEGAAGETADEFSFSGRECWMARDASKILCRLLDEAQLKLKTQGSQTQTQGHSVQALHSAIALPRLTDRAEWASAQVEITRFGEALLSPDDELVKICVPDSASSDAMIHSRGPKSLLERLVKKVNQSGGVPDKIVITGPRGTGKSVALTQAVLHARKRGWIVLFVPNAWEHVQSGPYVEPITDAKNPVYDNPIMTATVLRNFWQAHHKELRSMAIKDTTALKKYQPVMQEFKDKWNRALKVSGRDKLDFIAMRGIIREEDHYEDDDTLDAQILKTFDFLNFQLKTLEDLILVGLAISEVAGPAFMDLVQELRKVDTVPILFAVDQYNTWLAKSAFKYEDKSIMGMDIAVPHALHFLDKKKAVTDEWKLKNGICIAATSFKHAEGRNQTLEDVKASLPLRLRMPTYNQTEFLSAMSYYLNFAPIDASLSYEDFLLYRVHTASNPRLLRQEAVPFFFPRTIAVNDQELRWAMIGSLSEDTGDISEGDAAAEEVDFDADIGYNEESDEDDEIVEDEYSNVEVVNDDIVNFVDFDKK